MEAVQAISMLNDQIYYDRKLTVKMAKESQYEHLLGNKNDRNPASMKLPKGLQSLGMGLGVRGSAMKEIKSMF